VKSFKLIIPVLTTMLATSAAYGGNYSRRSIDVTIQNQIGHDLSELSFKQDLYCTGVSSELSPIRYSCDDEVKTFVEPQIDADKNANLEIPGVSEWSIEATGWYENFYIMSPADNLPQALVPDGFELRDRHSSENLDPQEYIYQIRLSHNDRAEQSFVKDGIQLVYDYRSLLQVAVDRSELDEADYSKLFVEKEEGQLMSLYSKPIQGQLKVASLKELDQEKIKLELEVTYHRPYNNEKIDIPLNEDGSYTLPSLKIVKEGRMAISDIQLFVMYQVSPEYALTLSTFTSPGYRKTSGFQNSVNPATLIRLESDEVEVLESETKKEIVEFLRKSTEVQIVETLYPVFSKANSEYERFIHSEEQGDYRFHNRLHGYLVEYN